MNSDEHWMQRALELAEQAQEAGEVPVGAIVVKDNEIIGVGHNSPISKHDPTAHAEILALRQAGMVQKNYRLPGASLYVTLEPCCMCAGAIIQARLDRLVYAAADPKTGAAGSVFNLLNGEQLNHRVEITGGVLEPDAAWLLSEFFRARR